MNKKRTIHLNSYNLKIAFIVLVLSYLLVFIIQHFGKFECTYNTTKTMGERIIGTQANRVYYDFKYDDPLTSIIFVPIIGSEMTFSPDGWTIRDFKFKGTDFHKYYNKVKYYNKATLGAFQYVLLIWLTIIGLLYLSKKYKIKIS